MVKTIKYGRKQVSVTDEVAEFLENDRRRHAAEKKRDERHLGISSLETVSLPQEFVDPHGLENTVFRNLRLENLRNAIALLSEDEQRFIRLYFFYEMSMERVGEQFEISKMAISKRLRKLYAKMRDLL